MAAAALVILGVVSLIAAGVLQMLMSQMLMSRRT